MEKYSRETLENKMQCGRVQLQERVKGVNKLCKPVTPDRPRRYCQKRLVNPDHNEDPRWINVLERFHCKDSEKIKIFNNSNATQEEEDLFLSVQNLKFLGDEEQRKRPRTSFKYKTLTDGTTHRMFVKQVVQNIEQTDEDRSSQLTCYYYDDYAKYLSNADRSRPSSGKSSIFLQGISAKHKQNKAVQVDFSRSDTRRIFKPINKPKGSFETDIKAKFTKEIMSELYESNTEGTKISFQKSGKRKSLTISRAATPDTVQVIRVDVVCNNGSSSTKSDYEDHNSRLKSDPVQKQDKNTETVNFKKSHYANKYLLTNTMKTLDENVSGGAKVTLLCKTFRLTERSKVLGNKKSVNISKVTSVP